jgi:tRNA1Val (adenine37-N6)-methyltransferase
MIITTTDSIFNGAIKITQPTHGFRFGIDAILLASSVPQKGVRRILDLGTGVGTALLGALYRVPLARGQGVDINPDFLDLASLNGTQNGFDDRIRFLNHNILSLPDPLKGELFDCVITNPPFYDADHTTPSKDHAISRAKNISMSDLKAWLAYGLAKTTSGGVMIALITPHFLVPTLGLLDDHLGDLRVLPVWSKRDQPAKRLLIAGKKGAKGSASVLPGLVMHTQTGDYTQEAYAVLKEAAPLILF